MGLNDSVDSDTRDTLPFAIWSRFKFALSSMNREDVVAVLARVVLGINQDNIAVFDGLSVDVCFVHGVARSAEGKDAAFSREHAFGHPDISLDIFLGEIFLLGHRRHSPPGESKTRPLTLPESDMPKSNGCKRSERARGSRSR